MGLSLWYTTFQASVFKLRLDFLLFGSIFINLGLLLIKSISTGVITSDEMNWVTSNQPHFSRVEEATALKLGRLLDRGLIQIGCRIGCNYD